MKNVSKILWGCLSIVSVVMSNPYEELDLTSPENANPLFRLTVEKSTCRQYISNAHVAYWIDNTFAIRGADDYLAITNTSDIVSFVFSMFPERAYYTGQFPGEICCSTSCFIQEHLKPPSYDCVSGVVAYKNSVYQLRNIFAKYPIQKKVVFLEPNTFGLMFQNGKSPQQIDTNVIEGYVNSLSIVLSVLSKLPNIALYIDGGQSSFTNATLLAENYKMLFQGANSITVQNETNIQFRYYTNVPPLNISNIRGVATDIRGYPASLKQSLQYSTHVSSLVGLPCVVDTSVVVRQPLPADVANQSWVCNRRAMLGALPTSSPEQDDVDAFVWITSPALSDGQTTDNDACSLEGSIETDAYLNTYSVTLLDQRCQEEQQRRLLRLGY